MTRRACLFLLSASTAFVAYRTFAQTSPDSEREIRTIVQNQQDAWNRGDAAAFATGYAENGSFTNVIGMQAYGRAAFVTQHERIFSTIYKGSHNTLAVGRIVFLRPDVAVVDIDSTLSGAKQLPPGLKAGSDGALHTKLQEVMTREKGRWVVAAFHNVAVYPVPDAPPPAQQVQ